MGVGDLLKTDAEVYIAATGTAIPDETSINAGASWGASWTNLGLTNGPLAFKHEKSYFDHQVEQYPGAVARKVTGEICEFEVLLGEVTANNLARALGRNTTDVTTTAAGASQKGYEEFTGGGVFDLDNWMIGFEGKRVLSDGSTQPVRLFIDKCTLHLNGQLTFSARNDDATGIPLMVKALADTSNSGRFYRWQRVTAAAT